VTPIPTPPPFPDDVDVAIVAHNARIPLARVFACLHAAGASPDRIALYDVGSTDATSEWVRSEWPGVTVRRLEQNVGPDPGRNWALRAATRPYVLLLDADAYIRPDVPALLREAFNSRPRVGTTTPIVVHADDPGRLQYAGGGLHFICEAVNPFAGRPLGDRGSDTRDIGAAPAVALMIDRAAATAVGNWDDRYFIGKEDGDFSHRIRMGGYHLLEVPQAIVEHQVKPRSTWLFVHQIRNRWHFLLKNYEVRTLMILAPALVIHESLQFAMLVGKGHFREWRQALRELRPWLTTLRAERAVIQGMRHRPDRDLLEVAPLIVRADMVGGSAGRIAKRLYDGWLSVYWRLARPLLSR
jgi:GT2 family glycosyltransferase